MSMTSMTLQVLSKTSSVVVAINVSYGRALTRERLDRRTMLVSEVLNADIGACEGINGHDELSHGSSSDDSKRRELHLECRTSCKS